eukprot:CAMPEP_0117676918 /NCGR_PEP_ID=MMETSP0804-20121206/16467_1 /TAXON_ID=1074897 /ORGANISM="Tetraselmis astigmatica, Strain CCMP880" /LENGTH=124 /DNA_ID=CAMNT_0005486165 /DNA_START=347 /DNA_END=718 /DNA_ORIENTATION=-
MAMDRGKSSNNAMGAIARRRFMESRRPVVPLRRRPWSTVLSARPEAARIAMAKPQAWNEGSNWEASTMPKTTGINAAYVARDSAAPRIMKERRAVKKGVVAPIAWLNDTGMYSRLMLPATTEPQ